MWLPVPQHDLTSISGGPFRSGDRANNVTPKEILILTSPMLGSGSVPVQRSNMLHASLPSFAPADFTNVPPMRSVTQFSKADPSTSGWELGNKKVTQNQAHADWRASASHAGGPLIAAGRQAIFRNSGLYSGPIYSFRTIDYPTTPHSTLFALQSYVPSLFVNLSPPPPHTHTHKHNVKSS